jgi:hypothetical protein
MKKTLIAILLVVFLLTMIVPTVFAAGKPPNPKKDCFGEIISNYAQNPPPPLKNYGQLIKFVIQYGWSVSEMMHTTRARCEFPPLPTD